MVIRAGSLIPLLFLAWFAVVCRDSGTPRDRLQTESNAPDPEVLSLALRAASAAWERGLGAKDLLTVIDYSLPSTRRRFWVIDVGREQVLFHEFVAHGKGSGDNYATRFSDEEGSLQSSLGLFEATTTYRGRHGYSLRLRGLEEGFNGRALQRSIVIHGAWYVSEESAARHGRLGRSWGCPALDRSVARKVIDTIKGGTLVFVYYPDERWLSGSRFLRDEGGP
jgi:hypothetical protein